MFSKGAGILKNGFRSKFESSISNMLKTQHERFGYEVTAIKYTKPMSNHTYTVDFTLSNGILIEAKGRWLAEDRKKHVLIKQQHPNLDIRFVFQRPDMVIRKGSKTTYADFCDKHHILWAHKVVPIEWLREASKTTSLIHLKV